jgi:hypothetical protein
MAELVTALEGEARDALPLDQPGGEKPVVQSLVRGEHATTLQVRRAMVPPVASARMIMSENRETSLLQ